MLSDAKAQIAGRNYQSAQTTLDALFEKHPGSAEVVEGRKLYTEVAATVARDTAKWDKAVGAVKESWARDMAARLRSQSEAQRQEMEKSMTDTIAKEWEKAKDQVRQEWAKQQG